MVPVPLYFSVYTFHSYLQNSPWHPYYPVPRSGIWSYSSMTIKRHGSSGSSGLCPCSKGDIEEFSFLFSLFWLSSWGILLESIQKTKFSLVTLTNTAFGGLLHASPYTKSFKFVILFYLHNPPRNVLLLYQFYRWEILGLQRLNILPKIIQLRGSKVRPRQILVFLKEWSTEYSDQNWLMPLMKRQVLGPTQEES